MEFTSLSLRPAPLNLLKGHNLKKIKEKTYFFCFWTVLFYLGINKKKTKNKTSWMLHPFSLELFQIL